MDEEAIDWQSLTAPAGLTYIAELMGSGAHGFLKVDDPMTLKYKGETISGRVVRVIPNDDGTFSAEVQF